MIWLQKFGSNSPVRELNWDLLPDGSSNQVRCSVPLHPEELEHLHYSWWALWLGGEESRHLCAPGMGIPFAGEMPLPEPSTEGSVW